MWAQLHCFITHNT